MKDRQRSMVEKGSKSATRCLALSPGCDAPMSQGSL